MYRDRFNEPGRLGRVAWAGVAALALLVVGSGDAEASLRGCKEFVGTYLVDNLNDDGSVDSRSLIVLAADGTFLFVDSNQAGVEGSFNPFTDAAGRWSCRAEESSRVAEAVVLDFTLPGSEGDEQSVARLDYYGVTVDRHGGIAGQATLRFFALDADPLNAPANTAPPFRFEGQRITTDLLQRPE